MRRYCIAESAICQIIHPVQINDPSFFVHIKLFKGEFQEKLLDTIKPIPYFEARLYVELNKRFLEFLFLKSHNILSKRCS